MRRARVAAVLAGLAAGLTVAGCGVPPSGVIQAGPAASGIPRPDANPSARSVVALYFVHDGALRPYPRRVGDAADQRSALAMLFDGPDAQESATATTLLPRLPSAPDVTIEGDGILAVRLPDAAGHPDHLGLMQLACTVAGIAEPLTAKPAGAGSFLTTPSPALGSPAHTRVTVTGNGWSTTLPASSCPGPLPS
ncbi:hypothetical protein QZN11_31320 [Streptomyces gramineus]|uniref:hypothetical protein n=1 Tax=Streptomyces gramineus TaxID=910542 RepID=UPI00398A6546